ncbi:MAG: DNA-binding protein [Clostridia bacterium]|nr:DNA-binding protein [Clostridia bacterium]
MFEKDLTVEFLLDFYGEVLPEKTRRILSAYYGEDLSLAEIAAEEEISRQGVRHILKKGEEELFFLEERLGLAERHRRLVLGAEALSRRAAALTEADDAAVRALAEEALRFSSDLL